MKKIKMMLALLAVLLCGGAWADYTWSGDMSATAAKVFDNLTLSDLDSKLNAGWVLTGTLGGSSMTGKPYFTQVVPVTTTGETRVYQFQLNNYNHSGTSSNADRHFKYANIEFTDDGMNLSAKQSTQGYVQNQGLEKLGSVVSQTSNMGITGYNIKSLALLEPVTIQVSDDISWDSANNAKAVILNVASAATLTISSAASPAVLKITGSGDLTISGTTALTTPLIDASAHTGKLTLNVNSSNLPVQMQTTVFQGDGALVYNNDNTNCGGNYEYFLQIKSVGTNNRSGPFTKGGSGSNTMMSLLQPSAITVAGGTLRRPAGDNESNPAWNIVNNGLVVTVKSGATFDINGGYNKYIKYVLEGGATLSKNKSGGGNGSTEIAGITLKGDATLNLAQTDYWVNGSFGNIVVALGDYTLTKSGTGELDLNNVQFTGNGTFKVDAGTVKLNKSADNDGSACSVAGTLYLNGGTLNLNDKTNFSTKNLKLASTKAIGNGTMTVNGEIDISALTSVDGETAILTGTTAANLTLGAATTYKFPDNNQKTFKLCNGTLNATAAPTSAQKAFIGTAEKVVTLAYDTDAKTVTYTVAPMFQVGETTYDTMADVVSAYPSDAVTVTLLRDCILPVNIPANVTVIASSNVLRGAITGTGTIELACTDNSTTAEIGSWFAANTLTGFTGCVKIAGGRIQATAALESGVKIKVVNGGQLWILGGTWSNTFEVSGNGWEGEKSNNDISYAAIRVDGNNAATAITISGSITASVENGIVPTIGVHSSTAATISGSISCANGVRLISESATGVLTITGAINGGEGEPSPVVEKIGAGKVVFGSGATTTNVALKLSAGKVEKTASTTFSSATTDVENKLVLITSTFAALVDKPSVTDQVAWGTTSPPSSYPAITRETNGQTFVFASNTINLANIANGDYLVKAKFKGNWLDSTHDDATVYVMEDYVEGSNRLLLQVQVYDGNSGAQYTKCQNIILYQAVADGVTYIWAASTQGFYIDKQGVNLTGTKVTSETAGYKIPDSRYNNWQTAYEVFNLSVEENRNTVASIGSTNYKTLALAIADANQMDAAEIVMKSLDCVEPVELKSHVVLKMSEDTGKTIGTISGSGVVVFVGFLPSNAQRAVFASTAWTGTVVIEDYTPDNDVYLNLGTCANERSSLALDNVSGYFYTAGSADRPDFVCKNLTIGENGILVNGRFSTGTTKYTFKKLLGDGTITINADNDGGSNKHGYFCLIGDISEFRGNIAFGTGNNKHEVVIAADADDLPPLDAANYTAGTIYYASGAARPDIIADGTTLTVAPGGDLTVPADFNVANVTVKYAGTVLNNESGPIAVAIVDNKLVYSIKSEKENTVRPTVTTMAAPTIESQDRISFTISRPIPGLFYSVVSASGPTDSDFESGTDSIGTQATGSDSHTTSIDMPTDVKVKYFRVRVKATK